MSNTRSNSAFLFNGNVITLDRRDAVAAGLLIEDGRISRLTSEGDEPGRGHRGIDLGGATVLPGFIDPHAHPLALGATLRSVDCSPGVVKSISQIVDRIAGAAAGSPGGWIRARGYDELLLAERRHPTAADLDRAAPGRCVRLSHGSGHGDVLSTAAMTAVGLDQNSTPPPGTTIEHDPASGELTGVMFEMGGWLRDRMPSPSNEALNDYARAASSALVAAGVTAVTDAGRDNTADRFDLYARLVTEDRFLPRPTVMLSPSAKCPIPGGVSGVKTGARKIAITFSGGEMHPDFDQLVALITSAHRAASQVAVHAVELEAIVMACEAFAAIGSRTRVVERRHRIEHASECPPEIAHMLAATGLSVVTQPGFIHDRGDRYLSALVTEAGGANPADLYAARNLLDAGVVVAGSSDAPFGPVRPLTGIQAAVTRTSSSGESLGREQAIPIKEALRLYGPNAAWLDHQEGEIGSLEPGKRADLVVLGSDPRQVAPSEIGSIPVVATLIGGGLAHGSL